MTPDDRDDPEVTGRDRPGTYKDGDGRNKEYDGEEEFQATLFFDERSVVTLYLMMSRLSCELI